MGRVEIWPDLRLHTQMKTPRHQFFYPRRAGGRFYAPPVFQVFANIKKKQRHVAPPLWHTCLYIFSAHVKISDQITQGQVTRSRQVTSLQKSLNASHSYTECPITLKLSEIDIRTSIYKMFISKFWYRWPKVRPILRPWRLIMEWLSIISQWKKNERRLFWNKPIRNTLDIGLQVDLTPWVGILRPVTSRHVAKIISGHERSSVVFRL